MLYKYGMRLRGFSLGCQPMNGFVERQDDTTRKYHDILLYNRQLTEEELKNYELDYLGCICTTWEELLIKFANQIKLAFYEEFDELIPSIMADKIDNLVKEFLE